MRSRRQKIAFAAAVAFLTGVLVLGYASSTSEDTPAEFTPMTVAPAVEYQP